MLSILQPHTESLARIPLEWDADKVRAAERSADAGNLRLAAELCEALLTDDRVKGVLPTRARGLLGTAPSFEPGGGGARTAARLERYLDAKEDWWTIAPDSQLARLNTWGILLGVAIAQLVWVPGPKERALPTLDVWHPRNLRVDTHGRWVIYTEDAGDVPVEGSNQWVLHTPEGRKRPWSYGAWRAIARWALLKAYARQDWASQGERAAGFLAAKPPTLTDGSRAEDVDERRRTNKLRLAQDLSDLRKNGAIVLPAGFDVTLFQMAANTHETFNAQIETANTGIAIALAGQNLTSEVQGGSFAAAQVHARVANVLLAADASALSDTMHEVLGHWSLHNVGRDFVAPWPVWDTSPPEDLAAKAASWSATVAAVGPWNAALAPLGLEVDLVEIARRADLPTRAITEARDGGGPGRSTSTTSPSGS